MSDLQEWVFECVIQFLKSPLWTAPVEGFIDDHCHEFDSAEEENRLEYTKLHNEFRELIDNLLSSYVEELGVDLGAFMEAIKNPTPSGAAEEDSVQEELANMLVDYIVCLDDFPTFRAIMEKRNTEMDLEAMQEYARYASYPADEELTEEEQFLVEMAIQLSLAHSDIALKELEVNDRQMLQELTVKLAQEQERILREQLDEDKREQATQALNEEFHSTVLAKREECLEKGLTQIAEAQSQPKKEAPLYSTPVKRMSKADDLSPKKVVQQALAPVTERRQGGVFGQKAALPAIRSTAPTEATAPQPTFEQLKAAVSSKAPQPTATTTEPSKEEMEKRAEYFKKQREILRQQKAQERSAELEKYKRDNGVAITPTDTSAVADGEKQMRIELARRFKEDLVAESRRN